jgi:hypothetical protein
LVFGGKLAGVLQLAKGEKAAAPCHNHVTVAGGCLHHQALKQAMSFDRSGHFVNVTVWVYAADIALPSDEPVERHVESLEILQFHVE